MLKKTFLAFFFLCFLSTSFKETEPLSQSEVYHYKEIDCLAKNIYHEASGEPTEGKIAVTQVVLNRLKDPRFPSSICQVVYEKKGNVHQFSWTSNPNKKITNMVVWDECIAIAKAAMYTPNIHKELASAKALFYHADYVNPGWKKKNVITKIGRHIFYTKLK